MKCYQDQCSPAAEEIESWVLFFGKKGGSSVTTEGGGQDGWMVNKVRTATADGHVLPVSYNTKR